MSKVMLVLPQELLIEVDEIAREERMNRSAFIREAVGHYLKEFHLKRIREQLAKDCEELAKLYPDIKAEIGDEIWIQAENEALMELEEKKSEDE